MFNRQLGTCQLHSNMDSLGLKNVHLMLHAVLDLAVIVLNFSLLVAEVKSTSP